MNSVHFSSKTNEWTTPQDLFEKLNNIFHFTLDPCCTRETAKCSRYFTIDDDGLSKSWHREIVFMNPPYGDEIGRWMRKAYRESQWTPTPVVCLIPARTDTEFWHGQVMKAHYVHLVKGHIHFGSSEAGAPFPSAIVVFGTEIDSLPVNGAGFHPGR